MAPQRYRLNRKGRTMLPTTDNNKPPIHPYIIMLIGAIAVSFSAIFVKMSSAPAEVLAAYRLLFMVLLMTPFVYKYRQDLKGLTAKQWLQTALAGFFLAIHFIFWFESLNYTSIASSVVLVTLQPLFVIAGAYLIFKERVTKAGLTSVFIALFGSLVIGWGDFQIGGKALYGDLLALLGALWVSLYMLFGQGLRKGMNLFAYTYLVYGTSALFLVAYVFIIGESFGPYPAKEWWLFLLLAVVPTLLGHTLFNWILKWVSASHISMSILGEPIGASLLAYFIFGEILTWSQWVGGTLILIGIYWFMRSHNEEKQPALVELQVTHER
jgi:drug/metabolite transporter (DMT)-like permease